jgi:squalene-hopene/tetraprenyl-beta-curcumene cyclase
MKGVKVFFTPLITSLLCSYLFAQPSPRERLEESYKKGAEFLVSKQDKEGFWRFGKFPCMGFTALAAYALGGAPKELRKNYEQSIDRALKYIISRQNEDGSFSEPDGSNKTYVTSIVLMVLGTLGKEKYKLQIKRAQDFLVGGQKKDGIDRGGSGYGDIKPSGKERTKCNLSTTGFACEGLKVSGLPKDSVYWKNVVEFLTKCQQNSETNTDPQLRKHLAKMGIRIGNDGGFTYAPDESKAGMKKLPSGEKVLVSYGSMTYEGLKSFIYAGLKKDDPRVQAAMRWIKNHYTLDRHPGFGIDRIKRTHLQGLFYYYMMFAKALDAWGEEVLITADGKRHLWAQELLDKLISLQTEEEKRAWKNKAPRWMEDNSVLVTSYVLIAYNTIRKWLK